MTRWQEPLTRFLIRYTSSEPDALDLAQDTFVRVYEARTRYDARGNFSTWLYTTAGNLCRNHARYKTRHPALSLDAEISPDGDATLGEQLPDDGATPAASADEMERAAAVRDAIAALPDEQRTATILLNTKASRTPRSPLSWAARRRRSRRGGIGRGKLCASGWSAG